MKRKSEFIGKHNRTLEEVFTKVTRMTDQACAFQEFFRRQFYDFTFYNLNAAHSDLNARVADLKSVDSNFTKEENEKLQILLADQRGREKQVEHLETTRTQLFSTVCKFTCMRDVVFVFFCMLLAKSHSFGMPCQIQCGNGQKNRKLLACVMEKAENLVARYPTVKFEVFRTIAINLQKEEKLVQTVRSEMQLRELRVLKRSFLTLGYYSTTYQN